jgi:uncharacterized integral membrane protein
MSSPKLFAALILATAVVLFGAQNTQAITFHFLVFKVPSVPLVLPLFGAVLLGALLGWVFSAPGRFRQMRQRQGLQSKIAAHERSDAAVAGSAKQPVSRLAADVKAEDGEAVSTAVRREDAHRAVEDRVAEGGADPHGPSEYSKEEAG